MSVENRPVLVFGIHHTVEWWRYVSQNLGWGRSVVLTDLRGEGDISVVDDFYRELRLQQRQTMPSSPLFGDEQVIDVIARCRTLRWLDPLLARAMIHAMAIALDRVLERENPRLILSFPIDRYVKDLLQRLAIARQIPHYELTASVFPGMSMLLHRGALVRSPHAPPNELVEQKSRELVNPAFLPSYVPRKSSYTKAKFIRTLAYFRARAVVLKAKSWVSRDPLNIHYLDAQPVLGHKCSWRDVRMIELCDHDWQQRLAEFPIEKRILFGLQLFPEASIDYWIRNSALIDHESLIVDAVKAFADSGFQVLVKDHPLQFGFRQIELIERLKALPNVVLVPYDVPGNDLLRVVGNNFTCTGTLGLQAALSGLKSIVTDSYYSNERDFVVFRERSDIRHLPERVLNSSTESTLEARQRRIIENLVRGSFGGDMYTFRKFDRTQPGTGALALAQALGRRLDELVHEGEL